jgi:hypothetical protein
MKPLILLALLIAPFVTSATESLDRLRVERIRQNFINTGNEILNEVGDQVEDSLAQLERGDLKKVLERSEIEIVNKDLIDNTGSLVDAIGIPGKVTLSLERWSSFQKEGRDMRLLVLHEILRMSGVNDDNYLVSLEHQPRLSPSAEGMRPYCDLRVALTTTEEKTKKMTAEGFGAPVSSNGAMIFATGRAAELLRARGINVGSNTEDAHKNALKDLREKCEAKGYRDGVKNIQAQMRMENRNTNGFTRSEVKVVMTGTCIQMKAVKRSKKDQKKEICGKVLLCHEFHRFSSAASLTDEDKDELSDLERKWRCR